MAVKGSTIAEILTLDRDDLNRIVEAVQSRRNILAQEAKAQFSVGDIVQFRASRGRFGGRMIQGPIEKINRKNLKVRDEDNYVTWTVHPSLVTKVG